MERLGKVDNTPFDKLYYLAENCADCYYTSVTKTFMEIIKWSVTDRQKHEFTNTQYLKHFAQVPELLESTAKDAPAGVKPADKNANATTIVQW